MLTLYSVTLLNLLIYFFFNLCRYCFYYLNFFSFIFISWRLITILKWFLPYTDMNQPWIYMCFPSWTPLPPPSPSHHSGSSQCTSPENLSRASNLDWWSVSHLIIYVSMLFSLNIPPCSSLIVSKSLFYTSVSLFLFCI